MSESPEPTAPAPEEAPGWSSTHWQPEPDVEPLPVQRHASDPLVPGWGVDEPNLSDGGHVAAGTPGALDAAAPTPEPTLDESPWIGEPSGPDRTMAWVIPGAVVVGALAFLAIVVGQKLVAGSVQPQLDHLVAERVTTQLTAAGHSMDLYRATNGGYPTDVASLHDYGFTPQTGVTVELVPTLGDDYCLAGGPGGELPTSWYSGATGVTQTPCG